ncbi:hypothetical protein ACQ4PT_022622 [Festuca glaucescens]
MSKPKSSVDHSAAAAVKRPTEQDLQFLYLVLDDWENGYSVRKLDVDAFQLQPDDHHEPEPFTEPPLARFDVVHGYSHSIVAHGTKIVAMKPHESSPGIPAFDTATSAVDILPWPEFHMDFGLPLVVSMAGKLFLFVYSSYYLGDPPPPPPVDYPPPEKKPWAWTTIKSPVPFNFNCVLGYAVHPDGRTLFVSADKFTSSTEKGTFSFDADRLEWTRQGDWLLPFSGQAHYVAELDAWVGLCRHKGGTGHLCSSDVVPLDAGRRTTLPRWRILGGHRLFNRESPVHLGARLVYMGGTRFCVVETMWHKNDGEARRKAKETVGYVAPPRVVICITSFAVEHDEGGELRQKSYLLARHRKVFKRAHHICDISDGAPIAFWI